MRVRIADNGSRKNSRIEKNCFLDKIVAKVETWKNSRNQRAKKKPPMLNPKKIGAEIKMITLTE